MESALLKRTRSLPWPIAAFFSEETNMFSASLSIASFDKKKWAWFVTFQEYVVRRRDNIESEKVKNRKTDKIIIKLYISENLVKKQSFRVKIDWNCNFVGLLHHPFLALARYSALSGNRFQRLKPLCLAKDHWWGFITRNAHMVHIVN